MTLHRMFQRVCFVLLIIVAIPIAASMTLAQDSACTLSDHIKSANTNTAVGFCPAGTSHDIIKITENITLSEPLPPITGTITIEGGGHTISGAGQFRIFDVDGGGRLTIKHLALIDGDGGIMYGGAIRMGRDAQLTVEDSSFRNNKARFGGAIGARGQSSVAVKNSRFESNSAERGGAITLATSEATIESSSFRQNLATVSGGAIHIYRGEIEISNSTLFVNVAGAGGGLYADGGETTLTHVTMLDNSASEPVGAALRRARGRINLHNSIIAGGSAESLCSGHIEQNVGNLIEDWSCNPEHGGDPMLQRVKAPSPYFAPQDDSPAINAAYEMFCLARDQIGTPRPSRAGCDIGAIESTSAGATGAGPLAGVCTLRDRILAANSNQVVGNCPAGTSHDIITITEDITLRLPLPPITGTITIEGGGHTISGDGKFRIFQVVGGHLTVNNVTMIEGVGRTSPSAIYINGSGTVSINNSAFINNSGGAVGLGGIGQARSKRLTINNSLFERNSGSAIRSNSSQISISNSSFVKNQTRSSGGAIHVDGAGRGVISITNSTFSGNRAFRGGAFSVGRVNVTLTHVTMVDNSADRDQGGHAIYLFDRATNVNMRNSMIAGEMFVGDLCHGHLNENVGNFIADGSCASSEGGEALLGEMTGWPAHYPLLDFSPAVDAADERFCTPFDQVGTARPQGGGCDIGAIESTTALPALVVVPDICPLDDQIIAANTDTAVGNCPAGNGADVITLLRDFALREPLPPITSEITIDGVGYTISGAAKFRLFDVDGGILTVKDATLTEGSASIGGAIRLRNAAKVNIENVAFDANDAGWGGAIATDGADVTLTVEGSSFIGNTSRNNAGALYLDGGVVSIANSSFSVNSAKFMGGAIEGAAGRIEVLNSTISGNVAERGAGIYLSGADATMTHLTVADNRARFATGGGIYKAAGSARLRNSIVYGNGAAEDCLGRLDQSVGNLSGDGTCSSGVHGNLYLGELVGTPAQHPLYGDSPAIAAADARFCAETDQIGTLRRLDGSCDSGAIEASVEGLAPTSSLMRILRPSADCALHDLITAVNTDAPVGTCAAGNGADTIMLTRDIRLSEPLPPITSEVYLRGNGHTISGAGHFRIFDIDGGTLSIKNLKLANGRSLEDKGGAIRLKDGALTVADVTFSNNEAGWGGAIALLGGRFTLYNSSFLDNAAENRGGAFWMEGGCEVMFDSVFRRNSAALGERLPGPMHDHFGSAIEWGGRASGGCGDEPFAANLKVYGD